MLGKAYQWAGRPMFWVVQTPTGECKPYRFQMHDLAIRDAIDMYRAVGVTLTDDLFAEQP